MPSQEATRFVTEKWFKSRGLYTENQAEIVSSCYQEVSRVKYMRQRICVLYKNVDIQSTWLVGKSGFNLKVA